MTLLPPPPPWHQQAECAGVGNLDDWFPTRAGPDDDDGTSLAEASRLERRRVTEVGRDNHGAAAKTVCARCPVWRECLTEAVERREEHGIWGGAGGSLLRGLRAAYVAGPEAWTRALRMHAATLEAIRIGARRRGSPAPRFGAGATHGAMATYTKGCRCAACQMVAADRSRGDRPA